MKVYGDLLEIESGFLTLLDYKLQYPDIYMIQNSFEGEDTWISKEAWFVDENILAYEAIDSLSSIMLFTGADVSFWEDDDCPYCDETMVVENGYYVCVFCPEGKNTWTEIELKEWRKSNK